MTRLDAAMLGPDGRRLAAWYARVEWLERYRAGDLTADQLALKVLDTVRRPATPAENRAGPST